MTIAMHARRAARGLPWMLVAILACPSVAWAQYFGQNKVQYERFDFQVLRTATFDIYHYPEEAEAVKRVAPLAEQWRIRLARDLGFDLLDRQPLVLYASQPHFVQTQTIQGLIGEGTGGVTESIKRRMILPFASSLGETSHVLGHELVHAFQYGAGGERAGALPLWFIEGMAEYLTLGPDHAQTAMWIRDLAQDEELPGFDDLSNPRYFPYRIGHAAWAYLASRFGVGVVGRAYLEAARTGDALRGIETATGVDIDQLSADWQAAIRQDHGGGDGPDRVDGRVLVAGERERGGTLNVAPALSPDGKWLAYLSERGRFSIDLYLAEVATGRVVRRITKTDTDPHIESLQFVGSAGAWDAAGRQLAFTTISRGKAMLSIVGVDGGAIRELAIDAVDEAWHPTWSPDGRSLAFAGLSGGVSDLFVIDLDTGATRRLTNDAFADLQPAWAPNGQELAFVTDRFSSSLATLSFGQMRLGRITVATGAIVPLPSLPSSKHINPQWNAAGDALFLVADPTGVPNAYRLDLASGTFSPLTDVRTGVTGITELSPALSYAPRANLLAFSVFRRGGYDIRVLEPSATAAPDLTTTRTDAPPASRLFGALAATAARGAPGRGDVTTPGTDVSNIEPYRAKLSLDLAAASGGVGASSRYGAFFAGGVGMQFSDVIGDHTVGAYVSANGGVRDIGGQVVYLNRASRWNWGGAAMVQPYVTGSFGQSVEQTPEGALVVRNEEFLLRQTDAELRAITAYPFSRALRFEVQGGGRRIWFGRELTTRIADYASGQLLSEDRQDFDAPGALNLAEAAAALVYDQSLFGPTSPINGQRYRFEVTPTTGSLRFTSVVLDYRRYLPLWRPFTLAVRGLHVGRYGGGAEDARLSPLFLGYPSLVRGYSVGSFDTSDCAGVLLGDCPAFDDLLGSRLLVGNAELRFPVLGVLRREYHYGPVPIEGFLFADSGVAWTSTIDPKFSGGGRGFVSSAGAGVRVNAFGYAVIELALARPLDRPGRGWVFGFNLMPGF